MRTYKPDTLLMLALVMGLGTSTVQAQEPDQSPAWQERGARLAMVPMRTVMSKLKLEWADDVVKQPVVGAYFSDDGLMINDDLRPQDARLSVSWKPLPARQRQTNVVAEALLEDPQPGVYLRLQQRW